VDEETFLTAPSAIQGTVQHRRYLKPDVAFKVTLREELSNNRVCPLHVNFPFFAGIREVGSMQQRLQRKHPLSLIYSSEVQCAARLFSTKLLLSFLFLRFSKKVRALVSLLYKVTRKHFFENLCLEAVHETTVEGHVRGEDEVLHELL
jgi:hypothetical protein